MKKLDLTKALLPFVLVGAPVVNNAAGSSSAFRSNRSFSSSRRTRKVAVTTEKEDAAKIEAHDPFNIFGSSSIARLEKSETLDNETLTNHTNADPFDFTGVSKKAKKEPIVSKKSFLDMLKEEGLLYANSTSTSSQTGDLEKKQLIDSDFDVRTGECLTTPGFSFCTSYSGRSCTQDSQCLNYVPPGGGNNAPTDISITSSTLGQSLTGANATVATLSTTDADAGDTHTYSLVTGAGSTNNSSFNISGSTLRTAMALSPGTYNIRINTNDGTDNFEKAFVITISDDVAPSFESGTPTATAITASGATINVDINEGGTIFYVVLPNNSSAPSSADIVGGTGNAASAIASNSQLVNTGTFSHSFNITGLSAGTPYDVYIVAQDDEGTPNLQASPQLVEFTTLCNLIASASVASAIACNGGTGNVTASPSGGTSAYTYAWSDGSSQTTQTATGLSANTYTVTVTDSNGCTATASETLTEPAVLTGGTISPN